jgi:DNA-binding LacI/PurR family transcriptional regulator
MEVDAAEAIERLFGITDGNLRPTAVVVNNGGRAAGAARALLDRGLQIPRDVSVVAIARDVTIDYAPVRLTRVRMDFEQVGRAAVRLVVESPGTGKPLPRRVLIPPTVIEGETVAAPTL